MSGEGGDSDEKIYADWDCPEVEIVSDYSAEVNNSLETNHPDPVGGDTAGNDYLDVKSGERMKVMRKLTSSGNLEGPPVKRIRTIGFAKEC